MKRILTAIALLAISCPAVIAADTATIKMKFVFEGEVPKPEPVAGNDRDPFCTALDILSDKLVVGEGGALKYVALYLDLKKSDIDMPAPAEGNVLLDNVKCMFEPHVLLALPGQTVDVHNSDATGHNANFNFFENPPRNFLVPHNQTKSLELTEYEPAPIPVECNVHPWMKSYLIVNPYAGISGDDGVLEISGIPANKELTFKLWHEESKKSLENLQDVEINGKKWKRGRIEVELKPGLNDWGTVKIHAN